LKSSGYGGRVLVEVVMEESLKKLMHQLGEAINDSLSESDQIGEAMGEIKRAGYDIFLVIEVTIGFHRREDSDPADEFPTDDLKKKIEEYDKTHAGKPPEIKFTFQDNKFLDALKISDPDRENKKNKEK
jgi:hypothetical protein